MKTKILDISRQNTIGQLSPWFEKTLDWAIGAGHFPNESQLSHIRLCIVNDLINYKRETGKDTVIIGMSGGVDSALTAALFKQAGWRVLAVLMPIHQNEEETRRGSLVCRDLDIAETYLFDLTHAYDTMCINLQNIDTELPYHKWGSKIRRGNIRARLRMITLYNLANAEDGLVASTDNFSELLTGFWTLHGDVGDLSPIQSLWKSWEVPMLANLCGVPEDVWRAKPTDGLGIAGGDEEQFGFSYLELDLMAMSILHVISDHIRLEELKYKVVGEADQHAVDVFDNLINRIRSTWFKRENPINLLHPYDTDRYIKLDYLDRMFQPGLVKRYVLSSI